MIEANYIETPYRNTDHALRSAYAAHAHDILKPPSYLRDLRQNPDRRPSQGLTPQDWQIQAVYTIASARRPLSEFQRDLLDCYYIVPADEGLECKKEFLCRYIGANWLPEQVEGVNPWYMVDVVREWAGLQRVMSNAAWAQRLDTTPRTLRRHRNGPGGVNQCLDGALSEVQQVVSEALRGDGIVP